MRYRPLGSSGILVSEIGFGCMSLSKNSEKENIHLLLQAAGQGINFFDTADLYEKGMNEIVVGKAVKSIRDQVVLATKVGNQWRSDGSGWDWNPRKNYILQAVENSLVRLQTDHIDLYQLHGGMVDDPIDETIEAFDYLKKQGKILHYGISSIRPNVIREYVKRSSIVSVMMQYSLLDRRPEETIFDLLQENNIALLARGALAQGLLVNKPVKEYLQHGKTEIIALSNAAESCSRADRTRAQTAIRYVLYQQSVASAIIGIRNMEQLAGAVIPSPDLDEKEIAMLQAAIPPGFYELHR